MSDRRSPLPSGWIGRWPTLEPLIDAALELDAERRATFFEDVRSKDGALAGLLERIVDACEHEDSFLSAGAVETFSSLLEQPPPTLLDECFVIEKEIGRGGMATVYFAHDKRHDRAVAVKVLGPEARAAIGVDRFLREIRVAARLQHAHVVPLYDSGDDDGWLYYVMPVMNGGSLRDLIAAKGPLPLKATLRVAREIASALEHAHAQGIVHRDIKPENILFHDGHALLADFGIARAVERSVETHTLTGVGVSIGTPGYMSPEQAWGGEITSRSDEYSLACVVYEMLMGTPLVGGSRSGANAGANSTDPSTSIARGRPDVPAAVGAAVQRALATDPNARFASAEEFVGAMSVSEPAKRSGVQIARRTRWMVAAGIAVMLVVGILVWRTPSRTARAPIKAARPPASVVVRPFENISRRPEDAYLVDGLADALTATLARIQGVSVAPRSSAVAFRNIESRAMGDSLHVAWVLEGTISHVAGRLLVRPTLVSVETGRVAWSADYDRELQDVIEVQRDIVKTIADTLRVALLPGKSGSPPANSNAFLPYFKGRYYWNQRLPASLDSAIAYFKAALRSDSTYALAYSGLADVYSLRGWTGVAPRETFPLARTAAQQAVAFDSTLAEAHASLGFVSMWYDWDWAAGQREIERAVSLDTSYASARLFMAWYLIPQGHLDAALAAAQHAQRLEPHSPIISARVGSILAYRHRFPEAESSLRKMLEANPGFPIARAQLARVLAVTGRLREAVAMLPPDDGSLGSFEAGIRGFVYAKAGDRDGALRQIRALEARPYQVPDAIAAIYAGLGDKDQAFAWLEKAYDARAMTFVLLAVEPMYDSLHDDPRFARLADRVGLVWNLSTPSG